MSDLKIVKLPEKEKDEWADPDVLLEKAKGVYKDVIILGWNNEDEQLEFFIDSKLAVSDVLYLTEMFKIILLEGCRSTE